MGQGISSQRILVLDEMFCCIDLCSVLILFKDHSSNTLPKIREVLKSGATPNDSEWHPNVSSDNSPVFPLGRGLL